MPSLPTITIILLLLSTLALAAPASPPSPTRRRFPQNDTTPILVDDATIADLSFWAQLTQISYCPTSTILDWSCGESCDTHADLVLLAAGGDDKLIPGWYVAYVPSEKAIVVSHQGTRFSSITSVSEAFSFLPSRLSKTVFPTLPRDLKAHSGFSFTHALTAETILLAVRNGMDRFQTTSVLTTGHSLGAALSTLDALLIKTRIPSASVKSRLFASPRIGNAAFSSYVMELIPDSLGVTNQDDPVPRLPPLAFGFRRSSTEVYISPSTSSDSSSSHDVLFCPGLENENCIDSRKFTSPRTSDHRGPYFGVMLGEDFCNPSAPPPLPSAS